MLSAALGLLLLVPGGLRIPTLLTAQVAEPWVDAIRWPNRSPIFCDGSRPLVDRIASDRSAPRLAGIRSAEAGGRAAFLVDYRQDPPILTPEYTGRVWIRDLGRYGDVPTVTTSRLTSQGNDLIEETWPRTRTETIGEDDEMVSRFDMSWPASEVLRWIDYGYDSQNIIHIATAEGEVYRARARYGLFHLAAGRPPEPAARPGGQDQRPCPVQQPHGQPELRLLRRKAE